ncbi:hypothetical protein DL96DRAFT_1610109 [Flagelloscypha sp. PMI_526]|nr:hypothetical protein DL96DRAFT_1610109 [Flagelloscypha sp. PMI_526]
MNSSQPRLPTDLERITFIEAAQNDHPTARSLISVCHRVHEWIIPIFLKDLVVPEDYLNPESIQSIFASPGKLRLVRSLTFPVEMKEKGHFDKNNVLCSLVSLLRELHSVDWRSPIMMPTGIVHSLLEIRHRLTHLSFLSTEVFTDFTKKIRTSSSYLDTTLTLPRVTRLHVGRSRKIGFIPAASTFASIFPAVTHFSTNESMYEVLKNDNELFDILKSCRRLRTFSMTGRDEITDLILENRRFYLSVLERQLFDKVTILEGDTSE